MKIVVKLDTTNIIKTVSRKMFAGADMRTRVIRNKKAYSRKAKYRGAEY